MPSTIPRAFAEAAAILDSINELFIATDREWRVTYVNRKAAEYLSLVHLEPSDLLGQVIWRRLPFLMDTRFYVAAQRAMQENIEVEVEAALERLERWFVSRIAPTPDGMVSYSRDVTARHRAEEAARANAELIQALVGSTGDPVFAKDLDGRYVMANKATAAAIGVPFERIIGRTDAELLPPDVAGRLVANDRAVFAGGGSVRYEEQIATPHGLRIFEAQKTLYRDLEGRPAGILGIARDMTERRDAEERAQREREDLQERIAELRTLIEALPVGIAVALDPAARQITANPALSEMFGVEPGVNPSLTGIESALLGYRVLKDGRDIPVTSLPIQRAARGESVRSEEVDVVHPDGSRRMLLCSAAPLFTREGAPRGAVATLLDVTGRRREERAQQLLAEATAALNSSLDVGETLATVAQMAVPALADCCLVDLLGENGELDRVKLVTAGCAQDEELLALARRYPPSLDGDDHSIARAIRSRQPILVREVTPESRRSVARDPEHLAYLEAIGAISLISAPLVAHGAVLGALTFCFTGSGRRYDEADVGLARNLADRAALAVVNARLYEAAQREVMRSTRAEADVSRWANIFRHAGWGVLIGDATATRLQAVNPACARMHGYEPEELVDRPITDLVAPGSRDLIAQNAEIARERDRVVFEMRNLGRDGVEFPVLVDLTAIRDEDGAVQCFAANVQDLTERARAEQQVRQAQKMEALGRLAGGVAHDFNNIIMAIMGFADYLVDSLDESDGRRVDAEEIRKAAERAAALTGQLLAFGRPQPARPQVTDLNRVVRDMELMLRSVLGERVRLVTRLRPELGGVGADRGQLEQVVMNLALNARDAMAGGGRLEIWTEEADLEGAEAYRATGLEIPSGRYVLLKVRDSGHGMTPEVRARIFEPFYTTRNSSQNSGLGLSVVYGIVTQSGGYLWVESTAGKGTTFTICFPRAAGHLDAAAAPRVAAAPGGTETILVVEDEETVRTLAARVLSDAGYGVIRAADGSEAYGIVADGERVDLVLSDIVMPRMSGVELAERLAGIRPELPVVFMSGYTGTELMPGVQGAAAYLQKPFAAESLLERIRAVLDRTGTDVPAGHRSHNGGAEIPIMSAPDFTPEREDG
ncbi:MAG TPA: PAS domain-containing protein [Gemmatimonadales bacterium]|nr:PAS domain-containing protein [Gemmatimonadales bacterium]